MKKINLIATTTFGLEAVVKRELIALGFDDIKAYDGRIEFTGDESAIVKSNMWLRCAGRVWVKMGEFEVLSFNDLFEKTKSLPWGDWIPVNGKFTVVGKSVKSKLFSVSDCQAIVKKSVVEKLKEKYDVDWFDETGADYKIQVSILKDVATLSIDTSGDSLHKRGYRADALVAPLKESLASAMVQLSYWRKNRILLDPFCGSGTIPIEAALLGRNIAPGINRKFASEEWEIIPKELWKNERVNAYKLIDYDCELKIYGSDIDNEAIEIAKENSIKAGVDDCISFSVKPLEDIIINEDYGVLITNPPYGERLSDIKNVENMYKTLGKIMSENSTWSSYIITSMEYFESLFGRKADAKRKLFNGRIKTDYYQFYGPRPPKELV